MNDSLELKSISKILDKDFFIPSYQRGYRWDSRQVEDLLEDILEFVNKKNKRGPDLKEFYCLQPVVVMPEIYQKDNKEKIRYRVIDGQQRLTTIYIILKYLENLLLEEHGVTEIYKIFYETRNEKDRSSEIFLQNIDSNTAYYQENIDFYYMKNAFEIISQWFSQVVQDKKITKRKFLEVLMGSDNKDVKIIWYELDKRENEINVFTRLNIGKIPLTNAELIKALFLINIDEKNEKLILSTQWDSIEYALHDEKLFSFINAKDYEKSTRIEFIFDLIADNMNIIIDNLREDDDKRSYYIFDKLIHDKNVFLKIFEILDDEKSNYETDKQRVQFLWDEIKRYFRIFEELYIGRNEEENKIQVYYHLVGFLINTGGKIQNIIDKFYTTSKNEFIVFLKDEIRKNIKLKDRKLEDLDYADDHKLIEKILFLFNVILTMKSGYSKYPFDLHKNQNWSLEHIHAQNSKEITSIEDRELLLKNELDYIDDKKLKNEAQAMYEKYQKKDKVSDDDFNTLQDKVFNKYGSNRSIHSIDNLALLSRKDNSALSNGIFPAKRDKIKQLDKNNSFIPVGTKNVFLKYFSNNVKDVLTWSDEDRKIYMKSLEDEIGEYIK